MSTPIKDRLAGLKRHASTTELDARSAHFEAERLATLADHARAHYEGTKSAANKAFDKVGRLSDRAEAALEAFKAYRDSVAGINNDTTRDA